MSKNIFRVKYFSRYDLSNNLNIKRAENILQSLSSEKEINNINDIIELYNIQLLYSNSENHEYNIQEKLNLISPINAIYIKALNNSNFVEAFNSLENIYHKDFWTLIEKFKCYKNINFSKINEILTSQPNEIKNILLRKQLVIFYDMDFSEFLRNSSYTAEIIISKYLIESDEHNYYLPKSLLPTEFDKILTFYIDSDKSSPNHLALLSTAAYSKDFPISDKTKLKALKKYQSLIKEFSFNNYNIKVSFINLPTNEELYKITYDINEIDCKYDTKYIEKYLDYPSLLNNFLYLFSFFDFEYRPFFLKNSIEEYPLINSFSIKGKSYFDENFKFTYFSTLFDSILICYYQFLLNNYNINLESLLKWFFEEYLTSEFKASGFRFNISSSNSSFLEKCKTLCTEMDGILKQFKLFIEEGTIDRDLLEISSNPPLLKNIGSLIQNKYAYINVENFSIQNEISILFSDQHKIFTSLEDDLKYRTTFELIQNKILKRNQIKSFSKSYFDFLISENDLYVNSMGEVKLNKKKVLLLKDLYDYKVICLHYHKYQQAEIKELLHKNQITIENTLFSKPEQDYLNFMLNKSEFCNGHDLRNKYIHGTYPSDSKQHYFDYISILKIMIIIIFKINEEFSLFDVKSLLEFDSNN